jgi:hypothetical protein
MQDHRITVRDLADEVGVSIGSVHTILTAHLGLRKVSTKFVPKLQLHHDNAPAHSSHVIQGFLTKHNIPLISQAPYPPDTAPWNFWLFPKLKMPLKGTRFESRKDATAQLDMIPQDAFHKCSQQWQDRWKKCVHYQGDYFERD